MKPSPVTAVCSRLAAITLTLLSAGLHAQTAPSPSPTAAAASRTGSAANDEAVKLEAFTVTGSNIKRLEMEKVLPVTVFSKDLIEARNAITPVEMLTALPQITNVPTNEAAGGGANARGDNANVNLRGIGIGYTLVLLNGRRVAPHPVTTPDAGQLAFSVNVNQLPTQGIERIDVLRDGASSIYGSDAVAGVINYMTRRDFRGTELRARIGVPEHGKGQTYQGTLTHGQELGTAKVRWLSTFDYLHREQISYADRSRTKRANHAPLAPPPFNITGNSAFDDRGNFGPYPTFRVGASTATSSFRPINGVPTLANSAPSRINDPDTLLNVTEYQNAGQSRSDRVNWFNSIELDITDRITAFADFSMYHSKTLFVRQPINMNAPTSEEVMPLAIDNPYNPYGSRFYSPTGAPNADGTPRLTGAPQTISLLGLAIMDRGPEDVYVNSGVYRGVLGLRGKIFDQWTWETGALYTRAYTSDISPHAIRESLMRQSLQRTDATAFNPFKYTFRVAGNAVVADRPYTNPNSVLDTFTQIWRRDGFSAITSLDFRTAGPIFRYWGNTVSLAGGGEFRREQFGDHRPPFVGVNPPGSGLDPLNNDYVLASPKPDSSGDRDVYSAYLEAVIPVVAPEKHIVGFHSLEFSASARYEDYSDFGTTTRPKYSVNWRPYRGLMLRGSYNRGFAAPNLPTLYAPNQFTIDSQPGRLDPYLNASIGPGTYVMRAYSSGNRDLKPITSVGKSAGLVLEVPKVKGLSVTVDYWQIEQQDVVGSRLDTQLLDSDNTLLRAYTQAQLAAGRPISQIDLGSGTANYKGDPGIERNPLTAQEIAAFATFNATRPPAQQYATVGSVIARRVTYENIAQGYANGMDFSLAYLLPQLPIGRVSFNTEWSYMIRSDQTRRSLTGPPITTERIDVDGTTRWRGIGTVTWRKNNWNANLSAYYIGAYADSGAPTTAAAYAANGEPRYISKQFTDGAVAYRYHVRDVVSYNGAIGYRFNRDASRWLRNTSVRLGVVNLFDTEPPLTPDTAGYSTSVHASLFPGRTWTVELTRQF